MEDADQIILFDIGKKIGYSMYAIACASHQVQNLKERFEHMDCDDILENLDIAYSKLEGI